MGCRRSLTRYAQMSTYVSHEDSFRGREIEEVNSSVSSLQMQFKNAVPAIRTFKPPFGAVHLQRGFTFGGCAIQPMDIKILSIPRVAVLLQVYQSTHNGSKTWLVPVESPYLIFDRITKVETWKEMYSLVP